MKVQVYIKKAATSFDIDTDTIDPAGFQYLVEYGAKQSLSDAIAGSKDFATANEMTEAQAIDVLLAKRLARIEAGTVGSGGQTGDPIRREVRALLAANVKGWKDLDRGVKDGKISNVMGGIGADGKANKAAVAILTLAKERVEALGTVTAADDAEALQGL